MTYSDGYQCGHRQRRPRLILGPAREHRLLPGRVAAARLQAVRPGVRVEVRKTVAARNGISLLNSNLYVYGLPVCSECAKGVIQVGIKSVYVLTDSMNVRDTWVESWKKTTDMFDEVGISYEWVTMDSGPDWS